MSLVIEKLSAGYGSAVVVRDVDLTVRAGECHALLGRNGMGKTTLVKAVLGLLPPRSGSVAVAGADVTGWAPHRIVRRGIGYAPQEAALFGDLTVADNLRAQSSGRRLRPTDPDHPIRHFPVLLKRLSQRAGTLSGGEQKMLNLVRALSCRPDVLILDEISEGLQPSVVDRVHDLIAAERSRRELTVLLVEQNLEFALRLADTATVLATGRLRFTAAAADPATRSRVLESFAL
ncbi:ABC transporter ATP-binding protein [Actinomadura sp. B10D3]|uniref:ABC transporter ATP-binding protein n=1 Tax=Actinomadura sp. B10D3 TaxID=3153557 RepID=UPI00325DF4A4